MILNIPMADAGTTWAEWVGIAVSFVSAVAVFVLGSRANRVAQEAKKIADGSDSRARSERSREAHLLLCYLRMEIRVAKVAVQGLVKTVGDIDTALFATDVPTREKIEPDLTRINLALLESVLARLHVLNDKEARAAGLALGIHKTMVREHAIIKTLFKMNQDDEDQNRNKQVRELLVTYFDQTKRRADDLSRELEFLDEVATKAIDG